MADLIEINVQADVRPVNNLISALGKASNAANLADKNMRDLERSIKRGLGGGVDGLLRTFSRLERAGMSLSDVQKGLAQDSKMLAQANQAQVNSLLGVDRATKSARDSASAMRAAFDEQERAARQNNATLEQAQRGYNQLRMALDQSYAARMRIRQASQTLRQAVEAEIITTQEAAVMLRQYGAAANGMGVGSQFASRRINDVGMATQQAGYQIGDFLVQVQSGTNMFVAFGQQATQLVGILPAFAERLGVSVNRLIGISSALGIVIPIATAIGAALMRTRKEAEDAGTAVERLKENLDKLEKVSLDTVRQDFVAISAEAGKLIEILGELRLERLTESLEQSLSDILQSGTLGDIGKAIEQGFEVGGSGSAALTQQMIDDYKEIKEVIESISGQSAPELAQSIAAAAASLADQNLLTDELREEFDKLIQSLGLEGDLIRENNLRLRDRSDLYAEQASSGNDILNDLMAQIALNETILKFGEDSAEVENRRAIQAKEALEQRLDEENITGELRDRILEAYNLTVQQEGAMKSSAAATKNAADEAERLANAIQTANAFSAGLDQSVVTLEARLAEASGQQGAVLANTIRQMEAEADLNAMRARAAGEDALIVRNRRAIDQAQIDRYKELSTELDNLNTSGRKAAGGLSDAERAAEQLRKELEGPVVSAIGSVSNAWAEFIMRGFSDFKSFTQAVLSSFKNMIAQMIATAARNRIMLSMGLGGSGFAGAAAAGQVPGLGSAGFGMLGSFGSGTGMAGFAGGTGFLGGMGNVIGGFASGGLSGVGSAIGTAMAGATSSLAGFAAAAGAIALPLAAVAAAVSFFRSKTKELDSGLKITVSNMDALVQTFRTVEKSRFWGLSKKVSTTLDTASDEVAGPLIEAVVGIQQGVMDAAAAFGIAGSTFDNFVYQMDLSLKGLTEDQKMQKINEELAKMGDEFASLTGHFETMNELLEAANQRMQLQNRLDQLLGNNAAILARQREAELAAMNELNRPLAQAIFQLEDAQAAVANAFASLRASIDAEKNRLRDSFANIVEGLRERLDAATQAARRSQSVFDMLEGALSGRFVSSGISSTFARREGALGFLSGGNFEDEKRLEEALQVIGEPTEDLFGSFVDYARDFARTSYTIEEAKRIAEVQLTADEKQVLLLEEQIAKAQSDLEQQLDALDKQFEIMVQQYNALLGIDTSVKSVTEAIGTLRGAIEALANAQAAAKAALNAGVGAGGGGAGAGVQAANEAGKKILDQLGQSGISERASDGAKFQQVDIRGTQQLLDVARSLGVQTSGRTGAEIQQAISNAGNLGVNMDNATRARQFAMGGYHTGGLRMVGERGPELEATGASRIFSHNQTRNMFRDPELKDAVRSLKEEVVGLRTEQRQIQMDISKYTKRSYDIERKWDVDGLPATRT